MVSYIVQVLLAMGIAFALGIIFPLYGWEIVIKMVVFFKKLGLTVKLVSEPGLVDLGAIIVVGLYLLPIILISYSTVKN